VTRLESSSDYNATECLTKLTNKRCAFLRTEVSRCQVMNAGTELPTGVELTSIYRRNFGSNMT